MTEMESVRILDIKGNRTDENKQTYKYKNIKWPKERRTVKELIEHYKTGDVIAIKRKRKR